MPRGPQGQKRPADVIGAAVMVARIATGEISEKLNGASGRTRSGHAGGQARAKKLSKEKRRAIAKKAAAARWGD
ncbi:MAG TPA: RNA-binding protein [Xanthobacteraceae bacterium]|nr:RNA-binding protein [Xanthobacteraceae bacterium]